MESTSSNLLSQQVQNAVIHNPHLNHRKIHFHTRDNRVVIMGTTETWFEKQMAQEAIRHIEGIEAIENHLEVTWG